MKRPKDVNQNAAIVVGLATGDIPKDAEEEYKPRLHEEPGLTGKQLSGKGRAAALTPERRSEIARNAAKARWGSQ